ncbi:hypothetical protein CEXT_189501 [Caerostris extrusa]|uniref:Uncharacterized protein n=1 Tax=Caerostris extrusa TaxID=172846 RepID=A0AAV4VQY0_CAEEX|nr:hypothetical protein CEXT_189501 [Caerostris extrusa]
MAHKLPALKLRPATAKNSPSRPYIQCGIGVSVNIPITNNILKFSRVMEVREKAQSIVLVQEPEKLKNRQDALTVDTRIFLCLSCALPRTFWLSHIDLFLGIIPECNPWESSPANAVAKLPDQHIL